MEVPCFKIASSSS